MSSKFRARQQGASMVEFAFAFTLFMLLLLGLMELGRAVWAYTTIAEATRQGARYASVHGSANPASPDQIAAVVTSNAVGLDPAQISVRTSWNPSNQRGALVQVQVRYQLQFVTSGFIVPEKKLQLGATSSMIVAN